MQKNNERQQMFLMIESWKNSGQSQRTYCRQHQIAYHIFHYWYKRYRDEQQQNSETSSSFVALQIKAIDAPTAYAELIMPNGKRLMFHAQVDAAILHALLH